VKFVFCAFIGVFIVARDAPASKLNITNIAAGTTIAINVLEIKSTVAKARAAAKATKKAAVKVARKVSGK
jgi:hypothetical protein